MPHRACIILSVILLTGAVAWSDAPLAAELPEPMLVHPVLLHEDANMQVFAQSPTRKVFPKADLSASEDLIRADGLELAACSNESEQAQLVIRPTQDIPLVSLQFSALSSPSATIPAEAWSWQRVVSVHIKKPTLYYGTGGWETGMIPDPLKAGRPFTAPADENSTMIVEVSVPANAQPGSYAGSIELRGEGIPPASIPVQLTVWGFALPTEPTFATNGHQMSSEPEVFKFLKDAKVTSLKYGARGVKYSFDRESGKLKLDTRSYEESMKRVVDEAGFHSVCLPPSLLGSQKQMSKSYLSTGYPVGSDEFWPVYDQYLTQMRDFYRAHGWEDNVVFYIVDEIREEYHPLVAKLGRRSQQVFPELQVLVTTNKASDELAGAIDIWVVPWHFFITRPEDVHRWDELRARGLKLWCYMNSAYIINADWNPGALRFFPTVCAKYGFEGVVWWHFSYYKVAGEVQNPWGKGLVTQGKEDGDKRLYGGGYLFYPPTDEEPFWHSSLRWENYRQGIDEYEMMQLLRQRWQRVLRSLGPVADYPGFTADQAMRWWGSLLSREFRLQTYRAEKQYIHRFRQLLAHEIENILTPPLALVDLEPDFGWISTDEAVEVRGVADAGVKVIIGGQSVSTYSEDKPYIFDESHHLAPGMNLIPIEFSDGDGNTKTLYREVLYKP